MLFGTLAFKTRLPRWCKFPVNISCRSSLPIGFYTPFVVLKVIAQRLLEPGLSIPIVFCRVIVAVCKCDLQRVFFPLEN